MTIIIRIPANSQAYLEIVHDAIQDKHDILSMEYDHVNIVPFPAAWGYWKMEEESGNRVDATGNGHDGTPVGVVSYDTGKIGNGLSYQGTTNYLNVPEGPNCGGDVHFLISLWVKIHWDASWTTTNFDPIELHGALWSDYILLCMATTAATGKITSAWVSTYDRTADAGTIAFDPDTEHFMLIYYDGNGLYLELDGAPAASDLGASGIANTFNNVVIGNTAEYMGVTGPRIISDEVGIWIGADADAAITRRSELYNGGAGWSPY